MICVGGRCGDLTEDFQPDPSARVVGSGAVGSQVGSRNECEELGATIEGGAVYGEVACAFICSANCGNMCALCCQICLCFQKKKYVFCF